MKIFLPQLLFYLCFKDDLLLSGNWVAMKAIRRMRHVWWPVTIELQDIFAEVYFLYYFIISESFNRSQRISFEIKVSILCNSFTNKHPHLFSKTAII